MLLSNTFFLRMILYLLSRSLSGLRRTWWTYVVVMRYLIILHLIVEKSVGALFPFKGFVLFQSPMIVLGNN